ncbi:MAG TPA: GNAT family N-acetyltransferase [Candidatus Thermoplasmatota archaeon]|nr:GNAT family N-acetyltransferase [Candidatus Thermoplasmatota archaeon]
MEHSIVLKGRRVTLEPLRVEHAEALAAAIAPDDDVFRWTSTAPRGVAAMRQWILDRQTDRPAGKAIPFLLRDPENGHVMGSTSLFDWSEKDRCAEIGHTWMVAPFRRSGANREAKLLLLSHGFEAMGLARIQIVTDARNTRSREAIAALGATFEGILRNHRRDVHGNLRDSPYFSFIDREWPEAKAALAAKLRP